MTTHLLFNLQVVDHWSKFAEDLICLLMIFQLCSNQIGKIPKWLWRIKNLSAILASHCSSSDCIHTFFMTPTASSVWPTNSSSACSIWAFASSDAISSSRPPGDEPFHPVPFDRALTASRSNLEFSTLFLARVANIRLVLRVVFHPAKNLLWIWASWASLASPTRSSARAYFSKAVARGSSLAPV